MGGVCDDGEGIGEYAAHDFAHHEDQRKDRGNGESNHGLPVPRIHLALSLLPLLLHYCLCESECPFVLVLQHGSHAARSKKPAVVPLSRGRAHDRGRRRGNEAGATAEKCGAAGGGGLRELGSAAQRMRKVATSCTEQAYAQGGVQVAAPFHLQARTRRLVRCPASSEHPPPHPYFETCVDAAYPQARKGGGYLAFSPLEIREKRCGVSS